MLPNFVKAFPPLCSYPSMMSANWWPSGDSYSQTGFDPTGAHPSNSNPFGNPNFPGYTTSGGMNWLGQVIRTYNTSLMLDWNFAYGGATVDATLVAPYVNTVKSLVDQVKEFNTYVASRPSDARWSSSNSLFAIWIGVNDIGNSYWQSDESNLLDKITTKYMDEVKNLYNAGARYFVFLTVPRELPWIGTHEQVKSLILSILAINRSPLMLGQSSSAQSLEASVISQYNSLVRSKASAFKSANPGTTIWVVDTQLPFSTALNNPMAYGAPNNSCYNSNGVSCLWWVSLLLKWGISWLLYRWNNYHPGMAIQKLVAQAVVAALKGTFFWVWSLLRSGKAAGSLIGRLK